MSGIFIGTAGWNIPFHLRSQFADETPLLKKYSTKLNCVEINSSFYREHKFQTYKKWNILTPENFLFSVKLFKYFTHEQKLTECGSKLSQHLSGMTGLENKLGALLVQLPPSLAYNPLMAEKFFTKLKKYCSCSVVLEPRHISWASSEALTLLESLDISKVLADPEPCRIPKHWRPTLEQNVRYFRLHGTPEIYKSRYSQNKLQRLCSVIEAPSTPSE